MYVEGIGEKGRPKMKEIGCDGTQVLLVKVNKMWEI